MFRDTKDGANAIVIVFSVLETAKDNSMNQEIHRNHMPTLLPDHFDSGLKAAIDDLLSWNEDIQMTFVTGV